MVNVTIPEDGLPTSEVDIGTIYVTLGQKVAIGDPLVEVLSEKVTFTIEAQNVGTVVEILVTEGQVRKAGDVVLVLDQS